MKLEKLNEIEEIITEKLIITWICDDKFKYLARELCHLGIDFKVFYRGWCNKNG